MQKMFYEDRKLCFQIVYYASFRFGNEAFLCCRACKIEIICILLDKDALVSKIIIIFAVAFSCRKPKGPSGWVYFYGIERLLTLICAIVNFATLLAVSRCGNEWMLTVGVLYILLRIVVCIPLLYVLVSCMTICSYMELSYTIAWAFCIVRLNSKGSAKAYDWGWTKRSPRFFRI